MPLNTTELTAESGELEIATCDVLAYSKLADILDPQPSTRTTLQMEKPQ
jgi:hypothetical protein